MTVPNDYIIIIIIITYINTISIVDTLLAFATKYVSSEISF